MSSCPMSTPASSVPTTVPRLNEPMRIRPTAKPTARVRKIASSGLWRSASARWLTVRPPAPLLLGGALGRLEGVAVAAGDRAHAAPDVVVDVVGQVGQRHAQR